jgi:15-cis-phytoene synthase
VTTVEQAYRLCAEITKTEARNFYYGIRLLPSDRRAALCAVYALARRVDDIGDGQLPAPEKLAALERVRGSLAELAGSSDPVLVALADAARRLPIPLGAFDELIDGVRMDVTGRHYQHFDELVEYCRCVAGSIGRLCLSVFHSTPHPCAAEYADQLGIALQQTNILRDIREDLLTGRVYLPADDLERFGVTLTVGPDGALADPDGGLRKLIVDSADRARDWYADGLRLIPLLDRRSAACCAAMSGIYRRLLDQIAEEPSRVYTRRLSLAGREKAAVAVRALTGRALPGRSDSGRALTGRSGSGRAA